MAKDNPDAVILGGVEEEQYDEGVASGTVTPGDVVEKTGTNTNGAEDEGEFARNASDGAKVMRRVAIEAQRGGVGRGLDDDYKSGNEISYAEFESGDEGYLFVFDGANAGGAGTDVAANANISDGERLTVYSGGGQDGTLRALDTGNGDTQGAALFEAQEAVDNSAGSAPTRIKVRAL